MTRIATSHKSGFSLIELAVVLGIIALVATAGIGMGEGALKAADRVTTQERLATIKQALETYARLNGFLPCPADRALLPDATTFGMEARATATTCTTSSGLVQVTVGSNSGYIGGVPVRNLGLPDNYARDAWDNKLTYAVSVPHVGSMASYAASGAALQISTGDRTGTNYALTTTVSAAAASSITGAASGTGAVYRFTTSAAHGLATGDTVLLSGVSTLSGYFVVTLVSATQFEVQNTAYVAPVLTAATATKVTPTPGAGATYAVISHGPDGKGAFPVAATTRVIACGATSNNDVENCDDASPGANLIFYDTAYNNGTNASTFFDDYIVWGSNTAALAWLKPPLYDNLAPCSASSCSVWCARCTANFPSSNGSASALDSATPPSLTAPVLCRKIITDSTACNANCYWSGTATNANHTGYVGCP